MQVYTVSVVRLANPAHAELAELNATTSRKGNLCVCGESCRWICTPLKIAHPIKNPVTTLGSSELCSLNAILQNSSMPTCKTVSGMADDICRDLRLCVGGSAVFSVQCRMRAEVSSKGNGSAWGSSSGEAGAFPACVPNSRMWLNVSHTTEWVSLHPGLRWPGVTGLRVEVNGQV